MGGNAFAKIVPAIYTPRMSPTVYEALLGSQQSLLRQHFRLVGSAIEAPEKLTYGDLDILVADPVDRSYDISRTPAAQVTQTIASLLKAHKVIRTHGNPTINLAIPLPPASIILGENEEDEPKKAYAQVDLHICATEKEFSWEIFHAAHGDMWNMIGSIIRVFGLTCTNRGLFLRIAEIELLDRKKSLVFLSDDPKRVLEFLGLDEQEYHKFFASRQDMFDYVATCRMFWAHKPRTETDEETHPFELGGQEGGEVGKKKLKHNDRQRMTKRPHFREWFEEYIPKCVEMGKYTEPQVTREQVCEEAFEKFGVKEDYETKLEAWNLLRHNDAIWRDAIKANVPVGESGRSSALRALKRVIIGGDTFEGSHQEEIVKDQKGYLDPNSVKEFVLKYWTEFSLLGNESSLVSTPQG